MASRPVSLQSTRDAASEVVADLASGDSFEVLELAGSNAWGIAPMQGLVGYVDRTALDVAPAP